MYDYDHAVNVSELAAGVARTMGMGFKTILLLRICGMFHDIGKTRIPVEILNKSDKLTPEEYEIIKSHTTLGRDMLRESECWDDDVLSVALLHHERLDGSGYMGMKGDDIPLLARIIAVCDVYDALTSRRPYRLPWPDCDGLQYLNDRAGKSFDADVVAALIQYVSSQ